MWHEYFKETLDRVSNNWQEVRSHLRKYYFACEWNEVYDFMEFLLEASGDQHANGRFELLCNRVLEEEVAGYRFVGGKIAQITAVEEIDAIEEATQVQAPFQPVREHLNQALKLLSDRKEPDYRNSIKESVSAVEALCKIAAKQPKSTLADALKHLEGAARIHPALRGAFEKLYGYSSDADGIRHALMEESNLRFEDAKYMLVVCSAFVNYVIAKAAGAGITL